MGAQAFGWTLDWMALPEGCSTFNASKTRSPTCCISTGVFVLIALCLCWPAWHAQKHAWTVSFYSSAVVSAHPRILNPGHPSFVHHQGARNSRTIGRDHREQSDSNEGDLVATIVVVVICAVVLLGAACWWFRPEDGDNHEHPGDYQQIRNERKVGPVERKLKGKERIKAFGAQWTEDYACLVNARLVMYKDVVHFRASLKPKKSWPAEQIGDVTCVQDGSNAHRNLIRITKLPVTSGKVLCELRLPSEAEAEEWATAIRALRR